MIRPWSEGLPLLNLRLLDFWNSPMRSCFHISTLAMLGLLAGCQSIPEQQSNTTAQQVKPTQSASFVSSLPKKHSVPDLHLEEQYSEVATAPEDLWELTRRNLQLTEHASNPSVVRQIEWFAQYPKHMQQIGSRAEPFYHYVLSKVLERGLPAELALLPVVESGYSPDAYSSGHAAGIWQFIPSTAKYLGIHRSRWYDGRKDVIESTEVALNYLENLNVRFKGDWLLAMAAYNAGGGTISKAIRKNKKAGKATDFWSLSLPKETRLYVPRILAIAEFVRTPDRYNMPLLPIKNEPYFEVIATGGQINLRQAAQMSGVELDVLERLNSGLLKHATDPTGPHQLIVPIEQAPAVVAALDELRSEARTVWAEHKIRSGDTLSTIAQRYGTKVRVIKEVNQLASSTLRIGKVLLIPQAELPELEMAEAPSNIQYQVKSGDTLWKIARQYGVSVKNLLRWNQLQSARSLKPGMTLNVAPGNALAKRSQGKRIGYTVRRGDSLSVIADRYNIRVADIRQWNNLDNKGLIKAGQSLTLFIN